MKAVSPNTVYVTLTAKANASPETRALIEAFGPQFRFPIDRITVVDGDLLASSVSNSWFGTIPANEVFVEQRPGTTRLTYDTSGGVEPSGVTPLYGEGNYGDGNF